MYVLYRANDEAVNLAIFEEFILRSNAYLFDCVEHIFKQNRLSISFASHPKPGILSVAILAQVFSCKIC
jgi:hypothetical protein